jgi:hypothetical protein
VAENEVVVGAERRALVVALKLAGQLVGERDGPRPSP